MEKIINSFSTFFGKPFFRNNKTLIGLWLIIGFVSAVTKLHSNNNYLIFRGVFWHTIEKKMLYAYYPEEYGDHNLYGPVFSFIVAPFALLPVWAGQILWCVALAALLYWGVSLLSKQRGALMRVNESPDFLKIFIVWFCAHELLTALFMQQFNVAVVALILLSFVFTEKGKEHWATLCIVLGTFTKLYGIVGLAFFFFAKNKKKFVLSFVLWSIVCFLLPMIISSPEYQLTQWKEWYLCLGDKSGHNALSLYQNISLLGIVRKSLYALSGGVSEGADWSGGVNPNYSDSLLIAMGCIAMAIGYFRVNKWKSQSFRMNILAGILMFVCLFSSGTESSGYIIALVGCCIWYVCVPWKRGKVDLALMIFAFIVTSLSPSDLFPKYIRAEIIQPFALKALPVALIWLKLVFELSMRDYSEEVQETNV